MKIFIAYRFSGEDHAEIENLLTPVLQKFNEMGVDVYCTFVDKELDVRSANYRPSDFIYDAYKILEDRDLLLVLLNSNEKSEGMILEIGFAIARGIPVIVAKKDSVSNTYLPGMAKVSFDWNNQEDLLKKISKIDFNSLIK